MRAPSGRIVGVCVCITGAGALLSTYPVSFTCTTATRSSLLLLLQRIHSNQPGELINNNFK